MVCQNQGYLERVLGDFGDFVFAWSRVSQNWRYDFGGPSNELFGVYIGVPFSGE